MVFNLQEFDLPGKAGGFIHNLWIFGAENCLWMDQSQNLSSV